MQNDNAALAIDGGDLALGAGLLALVRPALDLLEPGGVLAVNSVNRSLRDDLPRWCQLQHHEYRERQWIDSGYDRHLIARGSLSLPRGKRECNITLPQHDGQIFADDVLKAIPMPERADPTSGFAPRGAQVEPGGPRYPFSLLDREHVSPPEIAKLYDQAVAAQWNANTDIPWQKTPKLPDVIERALGQVFTFLAENELSALYLPSKFISRIHPAYVETAMFLSSQMADEARHIDVFLKRARAGGGGLGVSSATTSQSLLSLLELEDFTEAAFLLSVLGEGTFLDLLTFIEEHAPDEVTAEVVRRARSDEARHVHFGLVHVRHALAHDTTLYHRLEAAVRRRAVTLSNVSGAPAPLQDGLTILAAGSTDTKAIARGHEAFRELLDTMHESRVKRLEHAGFTAEQARTLSDLHTPNFM
ncbi:MAG: ferritin-like domain-containing protein [Planctomycetaceae bacterium]|nr:ferritin-like domain-containing protein [Planctomycetales bacterium]MCB9922934.1 ferritin-like domain-containing protein [Planctomycetaceae bacterium]